MKSWQTLDLKRLDSYKKEIESSHTGDSEAQCNKVGEYYHYLVENNHEYGNLAYLAATNTGVEGRYANHYLASVAKKNNVEMTEGLRQEIMRDLALTDIEGRKDAKGEVIRGDAIKNYHREILKEKGLPPNAWTGDTLENIGTGAFMLNQGSLDQHEGNFTVNNINAFIKKGTETGSKEHLSIANFTGEAFDGVLFKTLAESSLPEIVQFSQKVAKGIQGNMLGLITKDMVKSGLQARTRVNYKHCFQAKNREALEPNPSFIPSSQEMQQKLAQTIVDPMAADKELYQQFIRSSDYLKAKAHVEGQAFQKIFSDIKPGKEADIEYQRIYQEPMPDTLQQAIFFSDNLSSSQSTSTLDKIESSRTVLSETFHQETKLLPDILAQIDKYFDSLSGKIDYQHLAKINESLDNANPMSLASDKQSLKALMDAQIQHAIKNGKAVVDDNKAKETSSAKGMKLSDAKDEIIEANKHSDAQSDDCHSLAEFDKNDGNVTPALSDSRLNEVQAIVEVNLGINNNPSKETDANSGCSADDTAETSTESRGFFASLFGFFGGSSDTYEETADHDTYAHEAVSRDQSRCNTPVVSYRSASHYDNYGSFFSYSGNEPSAPTASEGAPCAFNSSSGSASNAHSGAGNASSDRSFFQLFCETTSNTIQSVGNDGGFL